MSYPKLPEWWFSTGLFYVLLPVEQVIQCFCTSQ